MANEIIEDIVVSDLHLGNPRCNRKNIINILNKPFKRIILNGDVFSIGHKPTFIDHQILRVLEYLQETNRLIAIKGNHELYVNASKLTSLRFVSSYSWDFYGSKMLAIHGHKTSLISGFGHTRDYAISQAKKHSADAVFCGHNHVSEIAKISGIVYVNTGSFTNYSSHYSELLSDKYIYLRSISPPPIDFTGFYKNVIDIPELNVILIKKYE